MESLADLGRSYPQIVVFLSLALGYYLGAIQIRGFKLGATTSVLLVALVLGQIHVEVPALLKTVSFALFIFTIGYKVGPQFVGALKKEGINYIWVSLAVALAGLGVALCLGKLLGFDPGTTAGLLSGAMTQSATIGTAEGAIKHLTISTAKKAAMEGDIAVAYAITYIFGTGGLILTLKLMPRLLRIDLKAEARKLEQEMSGAEDPAAERPEIFSWQKQLGLRTHQVANEDLVGKPIQALEAMFPDEVAVERIKRGNQVIDPTPDTGLRSGDVVAVVAGRTALVSAEHLIGPEVADSTETNFVGEIMDVVALRPTAVGRTLGEISTAHGHRCFLRRITRQGHELPLTRNTVVHKCDVLQVAGAQEDVEQFVQYVGFAERPTAATDLIIVGLGIIAGTLLGIIALPVAGIPITLGVGGGVLVSGLLFGWLRSVHPTFGQIPGAAQWVFTDLGLNLFIACVGLVAGPRAVHALGTTGLSLFFAGVVVTLTPMFAGLLVGRWVLKMNPVLLIGALSGAETCTAALNVVKEDAASAVPVLGYTVPYAFGNVLLTVWGTVIVNVMHKIS